jgi:GTP-binding protein HflX
MGSRGWIGGNLLIGKDGARLHNVIENRDEVALLVAIQGQESSELFEASLDELAELVRTAGGSVVGRVVQQRKNPDPATYIGKGKLEEIKELCDEGFANLLVVNDELSPAQKRNIENELGIKVLDRTQVILDIFAQRAWTREGKLQVELAQLMYLLPRLTGKGVELSRLGGGIGTRGPGETKLEVDRRRIRDRIAALRQEIQDVRRTRGVQRKSRKEMSIPVVALCGYTNAGKSTLFNALTAIEACGIQDWVELSAEDKRRVLAQEKGANVLVEDKLFATLDTTIRQITTMNDSRVFITDTVGFIQKLPHHLVAAFRATLEEVSEADLVLHVVDASFPLWEDQVRTVLGVLDELGVDKGSVFTVYNKSDKLSEDERVLIPAKEDSITISALTGEGFLELYSMIDRWIRQTWKVCEFLIPYTAGDALAVLRQEGNVISERYEEDGARLTVEVDQRLAGRFQKYVVG